jgi:exoribonuclease-2
MSQPPHTQSRHRSILHSIAEHAMVERGLLPAFSAPALAELRALEARGQADGASSHGDSAIRDLTGLPWSSIDNDTSRDLDQLTVAEARPDGTDTIRVAVADVDALVRQGSVLDEHARRNTTSVYTAATVFPMLPEALSTDRTSLNPGQVRLAVVVEMQVDGDGAVRRSEVYRARVHNHAKLAYNSVAAWLDGTGAMPAAIGGASTAHSVSTRSGRGRSSTATTFAASMWSGRIAPPS